MATSGAAMLASDVIAICDSSDGISELTKLFGITRRQAEAFEIQARRVRNAGHNPVMVPGSEVGTARARQRPTEPAEPTTTDPADDLELAAADHARRIRSESHGVAGASIAQLHSRLAVLERNCRMGYAKDWDYDRRLTKRTLEILEGAYA
jgi:hypothetical protein